jgi:hypothetical protein
MEYQINLGDDWMTISKEEYDKAKEVFSCRIINNWGPPLAQHSMKSKPAESPTAVDVPGEEGVERKKLEDLTDQDAIEIFHLTGGGSALTSESKIFQVKQLLTTNKFYTEQTNLPGKSWWKIFKFLLNQGYYWDGSDLAGALSVRQQGDEGRYRAALEKLVQRVQNYFDERKENPRNKNSGLSKMLNYVAFAMSEAREVLSQSPASLQSGIVQKLRDANPYGKLNPNSTNKDTWIKCCDTLAKLIEGDKAKEGEK